jgi:hypothetical protein
MCGGQYVGAQGTADAHVQCCTYTLCTATTMCAIQAAKVP